MHLLIDMDPRLMRQLQQHSLYPLELDADAQDRLRAQGIDPSTTEMHYSPGTPPEQRDLMERIQGNVWTLLTHENGSADYVRIHGEIRHDLTRMMFPTLPDLVERFIAQGPKTGTDGVCRDMPPRIVQDPPSPPHEPDQLY